MQTDDITSGYLNLLTQFKLRTRTTTDIVDLQIMFWLDEYDLVADEELTGCNMVLAIYSPQRKKWQCELLPGTLERKMIEFFCEKYEVENVSSELNSKFVYSG